MTEKAVILTPYFGGTDLEHVRSINTLIARGWLSATVYNCSLVDHARAALAGIALRQTKFDMCLWVDHDIVFNASEAEELVATARELDAMVGAPVIIKKPRGPIMSAGFAKKGESVTFGPGGKPTPCNALPFGFTAMPLHWLRTVCEFIGPAKGTDDTEIWPAFACAVDPVSGQYMSEDYSFCERYRRLGGKLYLDTRRRVGHKGSYTYTIEDCFWERPPVDEFTVTFGDHDNGDETPLEAFDGPGVTSKVTPKNLSSCGLSTVATESGFGYDVVPTTTEGLDLTDVVAEAMSDRERSRF